MVYVLYHSNCYDGFGAAYAAWKYLGDRATYIPVGYGKAPPEMPDATAIYIVDFSYPKDVLLSLCNETTNVIVIDHHKTAEEDLKNLKGWFNPVVHFDMTKSGALLTWNYFHQTPAPLLIQHISDRDLWEFKLPGSHEIHKALVSLPFDFEVWDKLDVEELKKDGAILARLHDQLVEKTCKGAFMGVIDEQVIPMVNTSIAWSEVGDLLLKTYVNVPFVASFTVFETNVMWSLRSRGEFDVSAVAKKYGGGGHKNAAGFKTTRF